MYFHPESYPPTLNAVGELSDCFDHIILVHRPNLHSRWKYPSNVILTSAGDFISTQKQQSAALIKKISFFAKFLWIFYTECKKKKPAYVLTYDNLSLFAYHLIKPFLSFKHKTWYHNHDVTEWNLLRKYSISWFAAKAEPKAFRYLDMFSLPSNERLQYFPMQQFNGRYFFIPNYPSKKFYVPFYKPRQLQETVKIIFQGRVAPDRGIEQVVPLLRKEIEGYQLELVLKGSCSREYKEQILRLADQQQVVNKITFGVIPYAELPMATSRCHIGLGILAQNNIMHATVGTASNKIYEYAAVGLPVIYLNRENFTKYLAKYNWAFPAELSTESIKDAITGIIRSYEDLSAAAHSDFIHELNFEKGFRPVKEFIVDS